MPNLGPFPHGVSWSDVPTSVIAPVEADAGVNVVFGAAPYHLNINGKNVLNTPQLFNDYADAVQTMGYSTNWSKYGICEHMDSAFVEFGVFPVIYVAVNDVTKNAVPITPKTLTLVNGQVDSGVELILWTVQVAGASGTPVYVLNTDYMLSVSANNTAVITAIAGGALLPTGGTPVTTIQLTGTAPSPTAITSVDIIGGVDPVTGKRSGLEVIEDVFQVTGYVPGVIIVPNFSMQATVAAAMEAKSENINGCFACTCLIDVDTTTVKKATDVLLWKNTNNIVFPRQQCLFGSPALINVTTGQPGSAQTVSKVFHFASQQGPLMQWVDAYKGDGLPYNSPSNKNLRMNALLLADGVTPLPMHLADANMLNSQGVITALNWIGGWRSWGNRTACYPSDTDVHDMFIPVRRMFDYIGNSLVLTIWQKVDEPGNRRLIDSITNSLNLWLDGMANTDALLGGRVEFNQSENPTTALLNGQYVFHVFIAVPTPAEWIDFRLEYDLSYLSTLFPTQAAA